MSSLSERLLNGIFKENPTFVLMLGMCPTLAVTTSAVNGLGMGVSTMVVLAMSNLIISLLRKLIPDKIRIPAFIVIIASFVTIVELVMKGYIPSLYNALGLYIPLIVVNCIILGRAESYAYSHSALLSLFDGFGMGMGFTLALTIIGAFRELLGSGKIFNAHVMPDGFVPVSIFVMAPGAFFVLAMLTAIQNKIKEIGIAKGKDMSKIQSGCGGDCLSCTKDCKVETPVESTETESEAGEQSENADEESVSSESPAEGSGDELQGEPEETGSESSEGDQESGETNGETDESNKPEDIESNNEEPEPVGEEPAGEPSGSDEGDSGDNQEPEPEPEEPVKEQEEPASQPEESSSEQEESVEESKEPDQQCEEPSEELHETDEEHEEPDIEMFNIDDFRSAIKRDLPSGRRPGKNRKAMERAKAMLESAGDAAKEDNND
ncbi:MAG: electron transport complex subunit RsxE [Lachnospiraceae bacterium]|nr:electron transport complex subunit RsxE [Lachnospiraceae bacterium]